MKIPPRVVVALVMLFLVSPLLSADSRRKASPPNIIIILADDLGYGDLGCSGHPSIRTPNLDRMANEGMRFTDFYAAAEVCTPSRAALLTGRYPIRNGMCHDQFRVLWPISAGGLPDDEITIAEALKGRGYATACVGKWHLGNFELNPQHHPRHHGFDFYFGLPYSNDMNPTPMIPPKPGRRLDTNRSPSTIQEMMESFPREAVRRLDQRAEWWSAPLYRNQERIEQPTDQANLTRRYTEEALKFIRQHKDGPFFLYFAHTAPHTPLFASEQFRHASPRGLYGDVVGELDWSVGQLLEALREAGLAETTFVFFTSDNGPSLSTRLASGSAGLLKDGKGSTWEGGMRVPGIAWWPGRIRPGSVNHGLACTMDLFATALPLAGVAIPNDRVIDGMDLTPLLYETGPSRRETLFYYRGTQLCAVRKGAFKAHYVTNSALSAGQRPHDPPLLFQLDHDPSEQFDVATNHIDVLTDIAKLVAKHRAGLLPGKSQLAEALAGEKP